RDRLWGCSRGEVYHPTDRSARSEDLERARDRADLLRLLVLDAELDAHGGRQPRRAVGADDARARKRGTGRVDALHELDALLRRADHVAPALDRVVVRLDPAR